jgi:hypothetical protein
LIRLALLLALAASPIGAETVAVRTSEGLAHELLTLRTLEGTTLADGDLLQVAEGHRVTTRLQFRFRDGSSHAQTTVYTQDGRFRLVSDHVVQKGPAFPRTLESNIDVASGRVTVRYTENRKTKDVDEKMELPDDLANGLVLTLLKNVDPKTPKTVVSLLAIMPKPRLVKLEVTPAGEQPYTTRGTSRKATHYLVKVDVGGVIGVLADMLDKTPPDSHVFVSSGEAPAFVRSESPLYVGGPLWRIELVSPELK